jgi:hypothetical protein
MSPLHVVYTGSGADSVSYTMGIGSSFSGVKRPRRESDHSPSSDAEVKNTWISPPCKSPWRSAYLAKHGNLPFFAIIYFTIISMDIELC